MNNRPQIIFTSALEFIINIPKKFEETLASSSYFLNNLIFKKVVIKANHLINDESLMSMKIGITCIIFWMFFSCLQWYMVSVVHVYNRWSKSEIRCYVDGQMVSGTDMSWLVSSSDVSIAVKYRSFPKLSDTQNI